MDNIEQYDINLESNILNVGVCDYRHTRCELIQNKIKTLNNKGYRFSPSFLDRYLDYLRDNRRWYSSYCCLNRGVYIDSMYILFKYLVPTEPQLIELALHDISIPLFKYLDQNNKLNNIISDSFLSHVLFNLSKANRRSCELIKILCRSIEPSYNNLLKCCIYNSFVGTQILICEKNVKTKQECLLEACTTSNDLQLIKLLLKYERPNIDCLIAQCKLHNVEIIKLLLYYRIVPNKECINLFFSGERNYRVKYQSIMDIFINFGYVPDLEDAILLLKFRCKINDIYRFQIELGSELLEYCYKYDYFPYNITVAPTVKCLYEECFKVGNVSNIRQIINKGIKPDLQCLRNACQNKTNINVVRYLVDKGVKPDLQCLKNSINYFSQNSTIDFLVNQLICKGKKDISTQYDNSINDYYKIIIPTKYKKKTDNEDNNEDVNNISVIEDVKKISVTKINNDNENINKRTETICSKKVYDFFDIKEKKISFLNVRNLLIKYLLKKKLKNKKTKFLFKIDKKLKKILNIKKKNLHFHFCDLDNITYKLYNLPIE
jgi:hypothetical protein